MEETVPTIHTSMVRCNIFFMTENDELSQLLMKPVPPKRDGALGRCELALRQYMGTDIVRPWG